MCAPSRAGASSFGPHDAGRQTLAPMPLALVILQIVVGRRARRKRGGGTLLGIQQRQQQRHAHCQQARAFPPRVGTKARALRAVEREFRTRKMCAVTALVTGWLVVSHLSKTPGVDTTTDNNTTTTTDNNTTTDETCAARKAPAVLAPDTVSPVCCCCA